MLRNIIIIFSTALLSLAFAESTSSSTASSTSTAAIQTHTIAVGAVSASPTVPRLFHDPNADFFSPLGWIQFLSTENIC
jgi:hypothetical protein